MAWSFSYFFDSFKSPLPWMEKSKAAEILAAAAKAAKTGTTAAGTTAAATAAKTVATTVAKTAGAAVSTASKSDLAAATTKNADLWNPDFFYKTTLNRGKDITETGTPVGFLVFCLFLSYFCTYFSVWKGIKSTGKMVWVTCTLPYFILTVLLIKGLTLPGMEKGLAMLFVPDWSKVAEPGIWKDAAT